MLIEATISDYINDAMTLIVRRDNIDVHLIVNLIIRAKEIYYLIEDN